MHAIISSDLLPRCMRTVYRNVPEAHLRDDLSFASSLLIDPNACMQSSCNVLFSHISECHQLSPSFPFPIQISDPASLLLPKRTTMSLRLSRKTHNKTTPPHPLPFHRYGNGSEGRKGKKERGREDMGGGLGPVILPKYNIQLPRQNHGHPQHTHDDRQRGTKQFQLVFNIPRRAQPRRALSIQGRKYPHY